MDVGVPRAGPPGYGCRAPGVCCLAPLSVARRGTQSDGLFSLSGLIDEREAPGRFSEISLPRFPAVELSTSRTWRRACFVLGSNVRSRPAVAFACEPLFSCCRKVQPLSPAPTTSYLFLVAFLLFFSVLLCVARQADDDEQDQRGLEDAQQGPAVMLWSLIRWLEQELPDVSASHHDSRRVLQQPW